MESNAGTTGTSDMSTGDSTTKGPEGNTGAGGSLVERGKDRVRNAVDERKGRVARSLSSVATSLKTSSQELRNGDDGAIGGYVERVAEQLDRAAGYLDRSDVDDLVSGVERFARRNPALFIGAAFAVGVLGARFLKSSGASGETDGPDAIGTFGDREVRTPPVGSADIATGLE